MNTRLTSVDSCDDLLVATGEGLTGVRDWFGTVRSGRFKLWRNNANEEAERQNKIDAIQRLRYRVVTALEEFRTDKRCVSGYNLHTDGNEKILVNRLKVLDPYRTAFENREDHPNYVMPNHQYLFHCYVYQFHLMQFSEVVVSMASSFVVKIHAHNLD